MWVNRPLLPVFLGVGINVKSRNSEEAINKLSDCGLSITLHVRLIVCLYVYFSVCRFLFGLGSDDLS